MIVIVDYGMGNLGSIANMLRKIGAEPTISADPDTVARADKLVLPGVGAFDQGVENLAARGLASALDRAVRERGVPIAGLCLGMQLFSDSSEEGTRKGLGWLRASTVRFRFEGPTPPKVPHMGWNQVTIRRPHPLFTGLDPQSRFYFVHSFYLACEDSGDVLGETEYGRVFPSVVAAGNVIGMQFHPEKSHRYGMQLLRNFVENC